MGKSWQVAERWTMVKKPLVQHHSCRALRDGDFFKRSPNAVAVAMVIRSWVPKTQTSTGPASTILDIFGMGDGQDSPFFSRDDKTIPVVIPVVEMIPSWVYHKTMTILKFSIHFWQELSQSAVRVLSGDPDGVEDQQVRFSQCWFHVDWIWWIWREKPPQSLVIWLYIHVINEYELWSFSPNDWLKMCCHDCNRNEVGPGRRQDGRHGAICTIPKS